MRNYNETKINYKDYGFDTPAEMAVASWVAGEPINLAIGEMPISLYSVKSVDTQNEVLTVSHDETGAVQEVAYNQVKYAYRVL